MGGNMSYLFLVFAEPTQKNSKILMNAELVVLLNDQILQEKKIIRAAALVLDRKTKMAIPGFKLTWLLNNQKIGDNKVLHYPKLVVGKTTTYRLKVIATLKGTGSIVKTITFKIEGKLHG